jgi:hypothetical protein
MQINERFLKLSSRLPFSNDLELGQDIVITILGNAYIANCVKVEYEDQQNGTQNVIYKLKFTAE